MRAMIGKEFRQLRRDHRTVAMLVVMPLLLLTVFGYAARFDVSTIPTISFGAAAAPALPAPFDIVATREGGRGEAEAALRDGDAAVAVVGGEAPAVLVDGSQLFVAQSAVAALARAPGAPPPEVLFNPELATAVVLVPGLIGLILLFVGAVATSLGVVRERQAGTLEQLAVMPLRPRDVFLGKLAPYLAVATVDMVVVVLAGVWLFDVPFAGSPVTFALGAMLFLFVALGSGVLVSTVSENQGQAIQLAIMTLLPQVLLSGLIFPVSSMAAGIRWLAYLLPLTYFVEIARGVMLRGAGAAALARPLGLLAVLGVAVTTLAILRFRRDLAPSARHEQRVDRDTVLVEAV